MKFIQNLFTVLMFAQFVIPLSGCGEKSVTVSSSTSKLEVSQVCLSSNCHGGTRQGNLTVSEVTKQAIAGEWLLSNHNLKNGAGCKDCHEPGTNHPYSGICDPCHGNTPAASSAVIKNPDSTGKCAKCHNSVAGFRIITYDGITNNTLTNHFSTPTQAAYTSEAYRARYVSRNYEKACRSCHNPHDTSSQFVKLRQWARSGKGNVAAKPWSDRNFRTSGTSTPGATPATSFGTDCVRCHTSTGYINYLSDGSIAPFGGNSKTEGKEILACNACHKDYSYARRQVGAVTAYYNKSTVSKMRIRIQITYPNIAESNLCLNCHVGRETGKVIKELADPTLTANKTITPSGPYNFSNASFENSHYLTAGATIFKTSGFEFFSSHHYNNPYFFAHDKIGVSDYNNTGTSGPCITCHMKPGNHTFLPVSKDVSGNIVSLTSTTCNNVLCHNGAMSGLELESQKQLFNTAMDALKAMLQEKLAIHFFNANPYFFTKPYIAGYSETGGCSENLGVKNWQTGGTTLFTYVPATKSCRSATALSGTSDSGSNNMGAAFNYNLLYHDYGAFAHNRFYAKRLIYDSISWLFDGDIRFTSNSQGYFSDTEAAIQNSASLTAQQKIDACTYLFTSRTYTPYIPKDLRNWRPGSSASSPLY